MKILFNDVDDFIEELQKDKSKIERQIVRVNFLTQAGRVSPNIYARRLLAQCVIARKVVSLDKFIGDIWAGIECETNEKTSRRGDELRADLVGKLRKMDLEIRGGMIEEAT